MENVTDVISKSPYGPKLAIGTKNWGVVVNTNLAAGILLSTSLLGLVTYIGAFWFQRGALSLLKNSFIMSFSCEHMNLRGAQNTHISLFVLLFIDVLNVIGAMTFGSQLAAATCSGNPCVYTEYLWMFSRRYLVMIHLLTALISLLYLYRPHLGATLRCVFSVVSLLICVLHYSSVLYTIEADYLLEILICGLAVAIVSTAILSFAATGGKIVKIGITVISMVTFFAVYFPSFVLRYLVYSRPTSGQPGADYNTIFVNVYYFTNFNVFLDGLLCCLILKFSDGEKEDELQQLELQPPWRQQQPRPLQHGLDYPRVHVNTNAVNPYNRQSWN
ncbi:uncharacterized protein LOC121813088 [Haplochromis burtoni]|uniref:uncharacterized protein LOC121813088 n=1 Tax=Haplochromis burtoni TaxID=8153 RepID=UPI001C2D9237|nr:uncharacterized protein LOC121813088 [Haplochromis burtoni]